MAASTMVGGDAIDTPADEIPRQQVDYFNPERVHYDIYLPDGVTFITCRKFAEGERVQFNKKMSRDIRVEKQTGDARIKVTNAEERQYLIELAAVGWNLVSGGQPVKFSDTNLKKFLKNAPTEAIDVIERKIRENEPWLDDEITVEDIDNKIEELQELRQRKLEREEGKES